MKTVIDVLKFILKLIPLLLEIVYIIPKKKRKGEDLNPPTSEDVEFPKLK